MKTIQEIQREVAEWSRFNFPNNKPYHPLLGIIEEICELVQAFIDSEIKDAVGDIMIYMADYCERMGFNLAEIEIMNIEVFEDSNNLLSGDMINIIGALAHHHLKLEQGIRGTREEHLKFITINLARIIKYIKFELNLNIQEAMNDTWTKVVSKRNWIKNSQTGE